MASFAFAILRKMLPVLEVTDALLFALDLHITDAMPESVEVIDDALDSLDRKCLGSSVEESDVGTTDTLNAGLICGVESCCSTGGISACLFIFNETLSFDTLNPSSVNS